jgi:uncharacterized protein
VGQPQYRQVVEETIGYVLRDLRHPDGGFYSAEDADSPDPDGTASRAGSRPGPPTRCDRARRHRPRIVEALAADWYGITDEGNFEGRSIPNRLARPRPVPAAAAHRGGRRRRVRGGDRGPAPASTTR